MNRRNTIKALAASSLGAFAIGYWAKDLDVIRDLLSNSFYKPTEQDIIMAVSDTIIPKGDQMYGALNLGVPIYLIGYLEKCVTPEVQENIKLQIKNLDLSANTKFNADFADCVLVQREELLIALANSEIKDEQDFFNLMKQQTVTGFRTSQEVLTNHYDYKVIPGVFEGCATIQNTPII